MTATETTTTKAAAAPAKNHKELVDMKAPLVYQIPKLTREEYLDWVHRPYTGKLENGTCLMFEHPLFELCSKTPWYTIPIVWIPVISTMVYFGSQTLTSSMSFGLFFSGLLFWTFLEYTLHRWVFHADEALPDHWLFRTLHFIIHGIHHKVPRDRLRLVFPPVPGAMLVVTVGSLLWLLFPLSTNAYLVFFGGGLLGYVCYDLFHYATHHLVWNRGGWFSKMRTYHMKHHFYGDHHKGYGITSKFWDEVFGTTLKWE